jgi:hypothetical protein
MRKIILLTVVATAISATPLFALPLSSAARIDVVEVVHPSSIQEMLPSHGGGGAPRYCIVAVKHRMARPSDIECDDPSLKEEEPIHDDFNFGHAFCDNRHLIDCKAGRREARTLKSLLHS